MRTMKIRGDGRLGGISEVLGRENEKNLEHDPVNESPQVMER